LTSEEDIDNRFTTHPPTTYERRHAHESARSLCKTLAHHFNDVLPDGREKEVALTKIEEAMFWANASIARQPPEDQ